jgi:hypothetical protein
MLLLVWRNWLKRVSSRHPRGPRRRPVRPGLDVLEDRTLLSATWVAQGPGPLFKGEAPGLDAQNNPDVGAVNAVAPDPTNASILFAATTDGGVWRTTDATDTNPTWVPLTDNQATLAIGAIAFSPLDSTGNTVYAATGAYTNGSFGEYGLNNGGLGLGVLKSTDALSPNPTWTLLGTSTFSGVNLRGILPTALKTSSGGQVVLAAAAQGGNKTGGVYFSGDGGTTWSLLSGAAGSGLPAGAVRSVVEDPNHANLVYAGVIGQGVFRGQFSAATGSFTWTDINAAVPADVNLSGTNNLQLAAASANGATTLFLLTAAPNPADTGSTGLSHLVYTTNPAAGSVTWSEFATVDATTGQTVPNINQDDNEVNCLAVAADPTSPTVVWVTGSAAAGGASIVYRGDYTQPAASQWQLAVNRGAAGNGANPNTGTAGHSDSRSLEFDKDGNLLVTDDGGIYKLITPEAAASQRSWVSVNSTLQDTEYYGIAYDSVDFRSTGQDVLVGAAQDNGMGVQPAPGEGAWNTGFFGDVTHVAVDNSGPQAILYGINDSFVSASGNSKLLRGTFSNQPRQVSTPVQLAATAGGAVGSGLNATDLSKTSGIDVPFVLDAVDPKRLLIGFSGLYEDPQAAGDPAHQTGDVIRDVTPSGLDPTSTSDVVTALAYGGTAGGVANPDVAFVGTRKGQVFVRTHLGTGADPYANFSLVETFATGSVVRGISLDPEDWHSAFIVTSDSNRAPHVWQLVVKDDGSPKSLTEITGNLATLVAKLQSVVAVNPRPGVTALVVGGLAAGTSTGLTGAFATHQLVGNTTAWAPVASGLPNVDVLALQYDPTNDLLVAGTFGRGAWTLAGASQVLAPPSGGPGPGPTPKGPRPRTGNVTALVQVILGRAPRKKHHAAATQFLLTVTNTAAVPLQGPLDVVLTGLKRTIKLRGAAGFVGKRKKKTPFVTMAVPGGTLAPGKSVSLMLRFSRKPNRVTPSVFAGAVPQA